MGRSTTPYALIVIVLFFVVWGATGSWGWALLGAPVGGFAIAIVWGYLLGLWDRTNRP